MLKWAKVDSVYTPRDPYIRYRLNPWKFMAFLGGMFAVSAGVFQTVMWIWGWVR